VGAEDWKGRSQSIRFLHRSVIVQLIEQSPHSTIDPERLRRSYEQLIDASGFTDVRIFDLARVGSFPVVSLLEAISELHQQGKVELSRGDWSLASDEEKKASIEWQGQHYLRVQLK